MNSKKDLSQICSQRLAELKSFLVKRGYPEVDYVIGDGMKRWDIKTPEDYANLMLFFDASLEYYASNGRREGLVRNVTYDNQDKPFMILNIAGVEYFHALRNNPNSLFMPGQEYKRSSPSETNWSSSMPKSRDMTRIKGFGPTVIDRIEPEISHVVTNTFESMGMHEELGVSDSSVLGSRNLVGTTMDGHAPIDTYMLMSGRQEYEALAKTKRDAENTEAILRSMHITK